MRKDVKSLPSDGGRQYFMNILFLFSLSAFPVSSMIPDCAYFRTVTSDYFEIKISPARPLYIFQATNTLVLDYIYQYDLYFCQIEKYARNDFFYYFNFSIRCLDYYITEETEFLFRVYAGFLVK